MENLQERSQPADYIDVDSLRPPRPTVRNTMRRVIKRFYEQEFTARDLTAAIEQDGGRFAANSGLYATVRADLRRFALSGEIELSHKGNSGYGNPNRYKNKETS
jgi:hypothetical protein